MKKYGICFCLLVMVVFLKEMNVDIIGDFHRCVPQYFADDLYISTGGEHQAGKGVPQSVNAILG